MLKAKPNSAKPSKTHDQNLLRLSRKGCDCLTAAKQGIWSVIQLQLSLIGSISVLLVPMVQACWTASAQSTEDLSGAGQEGTQSPTALLWGRGGAPTAPQPL